MSVLGRMKFIAKRRLLVGRLAQAMTAGQLPEQAADLVALLYGEPVIWAGTARDAAILQSALDVAITGRRLPPGASLREAIPFARDQILEALVEERGLQAAAARGGRGSAGDDTEFRAIRAGLARYLEYLAEKGDYDDVVRRTRHTYASLANAATTHEDLARWLGARLAAGEVVTATLQSLIDAYASADKRSKPTRASPLLDRHGRLRWPEGGTRRRTRPVQSAGDSKEARGGVPPLVIDPAETLRRDKALLTARLRGTDNIPGLDVPADWTTAELDVERIVQLMDYPRPDYLNVALRAFGHAALTPASVVDPRVATLLEQQAAATRQRIFTKIAQSPRLDRITGTQIPDDWWRALTFFRCAQAEAGRSHARSAWPQEWDALMMPHRTTHSEEALPFIEELDGLLEGCIALSPGQSVETGRLRENFRSRGGHFARFAARLPDEGDFRALVPRIIADWLTRLPRGRDDQLIPGFVTSGEGFSSE